MSKGSNALPVVGSFPARGQGAATNDRSGSSDLSISRKSGNDLMRMFDAPLPPVMSSTRCWKLAHLRSEVVTKRTKVLVKPKCFSQRDLSSFGLLVKAR